MAQSNWTAPTFSFDSADHPTAWRDFYLRATDYLETLRIKPDKEDQHKRGWEQITTMFTGKSRQILQTLVDNNTITETDQRTPIVALKAIQAAIKNKTNSATTTRRTNSATITTRNSIKCPWRQFYKHIIKYLDSLYAEACKPQLKIARFMYAVKHNFASTTMDLEQKSTKQTQTTEQPRSMALDPSSSTKHRTPSSDTDSAYNTESESNYTEHLPRPPCNNSQQPINTKCIQGTKPSHIPIPKTTKSNSKTSHISTSTHQPKPSTSTWSNTQTTVKQPTLPTPRVSTASTYHQCTRKTPLLPTPPAPVRNFNHRNHYKQYIPGPSSRFSTYSTFAGPATLNNHRYYPQQHIPGPYTAFPLHLHQESLTRPYQQHQQTQGQFFTRPFHHQQAPLLPLPTLTGPYQQILGHFPQQVYHVHISLPYPLQHYMI